MSIPENCLISHISNSNPAIVETKSPHYLSNHMYVRLSLSQECGMNCLNRIVFSVNVVSENSFYIPTDTTELSVFMCLGKSAMVIPIAIQQNKAITVSMKGDETFSVKRPSHFP